MIHFTIAFRSSGTLILAAIFLALFFLARFEIRRVQRDVRDPPGAARQLFGYRIGSYLCALMFFGSLLAWAGLYFAVRFNWSRNDVSEIEVMEFPSPYPQTSPERTVSIKETEVLSKIFDGLEALQPYSSPGHEHAVGKSYILRLRRQSDGQWSSYRVRIYPDKEPTGGGMHMSGVYEVEIDVGSGKFSLGNYQAIELGRFVEQLAHEKSAE